MGLTNISRFDVCLVTLDPTLGSELQKTRPCLVISPDSMNHSRLKTLIIAPMTTAIRENFTTRVSVEFQSKNGQIALVQLRVIDKTRIVKNLGHIQKKETKSSVLRILQMMSS